VPGFLETPLDEREGYARYAEDLATLRSLRAATPAVAATAASAPPVTRRRSTVK
jgi:hypothetical protein